MQPDEEVSITLRAAEWNVVLMLVDSAVRGIIAKMTSQATQPVPPNGLDVNPSQDVAPN